jgi:hypothetical protein
MDLRRAGGGSGNFMRRMALFLTVVFTLLFFSASLSLAQIQVRMRAIHASDTGSSVDSSLRDLHKELGSLFSFTSYRLMRDEMLNLSMNQPVLISAREGTIKLEATLVGLHRGAAEVRIRVIREGSQILNTQVRLSPGRTVLVGGPRHLRGGVIIYALYARF